MNILFINQSIDISRGGPSYSTCNLCKALSLNGVNITLYTRQPEGDQLPDTFADGYEVKIFKHSFPMKYGNSNALVKDFSANLSKWDIVHCSNIWNILTSRIASICSQSQLPYIVSLRGMLSAWKRSIFRLDKELYYGIIDKKTIQRATLIHCLTETELTASSKFIGRTPMCVISNGIWLDEFKTSDSEGFREKYNLKGKRIVLFLGRLHPIKRLDLQCQALSLLSLNYPDLRWVFIGPDDGVQSQLSDYLHQNGLSQKVVFTGLLSGNDRISALAAADIYCQTSDHEGHSVSIIEALACGKPCIVTKGCNFNDIESEGAGIITLSNPIQIAESIASLLKDTSKLETMSENAKRLATSKYSYSKIALQMIDVYKWVLGQAEKPDCVRQN